MHKDDMRMVTALIHKDDMADFIMLAEHFGMSRTALLRMWIRRSKARVKK